MRVLACGFLLLRDSLKAVLTLPRYKKHKALILCSVKYIIYIELQLGGHFITLKFSYVILRQNVEVFSIKLLTWH